MCKTNNGQAVQSGDLLVAAQCLDDCLICLYPDEFTPADHEAAKERFTKHKGVISRIATISDKLKQATNATAEARRSRSLQPDVGLKGDRS